MKIKELSEKLEQMYGVDAKTEYQELGLVIWLAEDSGRISDLADDNGVDIYHDDGLENLGLQSGVDAYKQLSAETFCRVTELYVNHPSKHDSARMARVRCLLAIKS